MSFQGIPNTPQSSHIIKSPKIAMAEKLSVLFDLDLLLIVVLIPPFQVKCFEYLLKGKDTVAVLPTGFGKSLLFQLLPDFVPVKADNNIVYNGVN